MIALRPRSLLASTLLAAVSATTALADTTMNLGWGTPMDNAYGAFAQKFKELTEQYTDGSVEVKLRPSGQIGGEDEAFKALQLGTIDGYLISGNNISPHFGLMDVFALPYIFEGPEHAIAVFDGEVGDYLRDELYERTGVHLLTYNKFTYRDMYNTEHPVESISDLEGLKMRVPKNEVMLRTWRAFGAEAVPLAWSETPTALQTGTIDGGDQWHRSDPVDEILRIRREFDDPRGLRGFHPAVRVRAVHVAAERRGESGSETGGQRGRNLSAGAGRAGNRSDPRGAGGQRHADDPPGQGELHRGGPRGAGRDCRRTRRGVPRLGAAHPRRRALIQTTGIAGRPG